MSVRAGKKTPKGGQEKHEKERDQRRRKKKADNAGYQREEATFVGVVPIIFWRVGRLEYTSVGVTETGNGFQSQ